MADRERRRLIFAHQEWLGFVQPVGLVVSSPGNGGKNRTMMEWNQSLPGIIPVMDARFGRVGMAGREFRRACARSRTRTGRDPQRSGLMRLEPDTGRRLESWTEIHTGCARSNPMAVLAGRESGRGRKDCQLRRTWRTFRTSSPPSMVFSDACSLARG